MPPRARRWPATPGSWPRITPAVERLIELLGAPKRTGFPYWMESALWERAGVPAVVCGPAGGGLHTDVEWVELPQLLAYTETLDDPDPRVHAPLTVARPGRRVSSQQRLRDDVRRLLGHEVAAVDGPVHEVRRPRPPHGRRVEPERRAPVLLQHRARASRSTRPASRAA